MENIRNLKNIKFLVCKDMNTIENHIVKKIYEKIDQDNKINLSIESRKDFMGIFEKLKILQNKNKISFDESHFFMTDEYIFDKNNWGACQESTSFSILEKNFFRNVDFNYKNIHRIVTKSNFYNIFTDKCSAYDTKIDALNGIDILVLKVHINGNLVFNDSVSFNNLSTNAKKFNSLQLGLLSPEFDKNSPLPKYGASIGIDQILKAKKIYIVATGQDKELVMTKIFFSKDYDKKVPVCLLKSHPSVTVLCDESAISNVAPWFNWDNALEAKLANNEFQEIINKSYAQYAYGYNDQNNYNNFNQYDDNYYNYQDAYNQYNQLEQPNELNFYNNMDYSYQENNYQQNFDQNYQYDYNNYQYDTNSQLNNQNYDYYTNNQNDGYQTYGMPIEEYYKKVVEECYTIENVGQNNEKYGANSNYDNQQYNYDQNQDLDNPDVNVDSQHYYNQEQYVDNQNLNYDNSYYNYDQNQYNQFVDNQDQNYDNQQYWYDQSQYNQYDENQYDYNQNLNFDDSQYNYDQNQYYQYTDNQEFGYDNYQYDFDQNQYNQYIDDQNLNYDNQQQNYDQNQQFDNLNSNYDQNQQFDNLNSNYDQNQQLDNLDSNYNQNQDIYNQQWDENVSQNDFNIDMND